MWTADPNSPMIRLHGKPRRRPAMLTTQKTMALDSNAPMEVPSSAGHGDATLEETPGSDSDIDGGPASPGGRPRSQANGADDNAESLVSSPSAKGGNASARGGCRGVGSSPNSARSTRGGSTTGNAWGGGCPGSGGGAAHSARGSRTSTMSSCREWRFDDEVDGDAFRDPKMPVNGEYPWKPAAPPLPPHPDFVAQANRILSSAAERTLHIAEHHLAGLQDEVLVRVERLVAQLHEESSRALDLMRDVASPSLASHPKPDRLHAANYFVPDGPAQVCLPGETAGSPTPSEPCLRRLNSFSDDLDRAPKTAESSPSLTGSGAIEASDDRRSAAIRERDSEAVSRQLFVDPSIMKEKVRAALVRPQYNVKDFYKKTGWAQKVAKSSLFEFVTLGIVVANAIWIAVDADYNNEPVLSDADLVFQLAEHLFCAYFAFEWLVRWMAFAKTKHAFSDGWFLFDTALVVMMTTETWILSLLMVFFSANATGLGLDPSILKLLRMVRLTRMARMARLLRWMPELLILLKGLWLASKSVFFTLVLLMITVYVFALTFRQVTEGTEIGQERFGSVPQAMSTLLLNGVLPDLADMVRDASASHIGFAILLLFFILIATLTVMNMLVGVLVEVVAMVSTVENETLMVNMVRAKMHQMIEVLGLDLDGNGTLSRDEFEALLVLPAAAQFIQDVGVDVVGLVEYSEFIFKDDKELGFTEFVELILQLRGTNTATVKDIVDTRKQVMTEIDRLSTHVDVVADQMRTMVNHASAVDPQRNIHGKLALKALTDLGAKGRVDEDIVVHTRRPQVNAPPIKPPAKMPPSLFDDLAWSQPALGPLAASDPKDLKSQVRLSRPLKEDEEEV